MDAYETLRKQAAQNRDATIRTARRKYTQDLRQIAELRRALTGVAWEVTRTTTSIRDLIRQLIPQDRTFSVPEVIERIRKAEPGRKLNEQSIRTFFQRLEIDGVLRRVGRGNGFVLWASASYKTPAQPFGAKSLTEVAAKVLRELGPMRLTELVLAMRERGYRAGDEPQLMLNSLAKVFRRNPARFRKDEAGRWGLVEG